MNGSYIRIRLVILSNFHVENIFIRVIDYFILIFKGLSILWNYLLFELNRKFAMGTQECTWQTGCVTDSGASEASGVGLTQPKDDWST